MVLSFGQAAKALAPMRSMLEGRVMVSKFLMPLKAYSNSFTFWNR